MVKADKTTGTFTWFSDIHYDPFYGKAAPLTARSATKRLHSLESYPPSTYEPEIECANATSLLGIEGCDSPFDLVHSCITAAAESVRDNEFVLVSGDFVHHGFANNVDEKAELKRDDPIVESFENILSEVANLLRIEYPEPIPILPALGNNDCLPDYFLDEEDKNNVVLDTATDAFRHLLTSPSSNTDTDTNIMLTMFRQGGYYANEIFKPNQNGSKKPGLTILVLNTIIYSRNNKPDQTNIPDPYNQFKWLKLSLATARRKNVKIYVMGHIPPTVGSYRNNQMWHKRYLDRYLHLIHDYNDVVVAQLFGHLHSDEFRVLSESSSLSDGSFPLPPLLIAPSVTPKFGNGSPSFRVVTFDRSNFKILDYETRFLDIRDNASIQTPLRWQVLDSFQKTYGVPDISLTSLLDVVRRITTVHETLDTFFSRMYVNSKNSLDKECNQMCRIKLKCTLRSSAKLGYDDCVARLTSSKEVYTVLIVSVLFALIFTCFTVRCFYKRSQRTDNESTNLADDDTTETEDYEIRSIPPID